MNTPPIETAAAVETVKEAITARSLLVALKDNRIEVLLAIGILHLLVLVIAFWHTLQVYVQCNVYKHLCIHDP